MISSFSQEQFQQFYEFSGGGGDNRKVPERLQRLSILGENKVGYTYLPTKMFATNVSWQIDFHKENVFASPLCRQDGGGGGNIQATRYS